MTTRSGQNLLGKCHVIKFLHVIKFWRPLYLNKEGLGEWRQVSKVDLKLFCHTYCYILYRAVFK
jgi:hypothetical protein